jgi:hypothetical protein
MQTHAINSSKHTIRCIVGVFTRPFVARRRKRSLARCRAAPPRPPAACAAPRARRSRPAPAAMPAAPLRRAAGSALAWLRGRGGAEGTAKRTAA